jgi:hypothetical protein
VVGGKEDLLCYQASTLDLSKNGTCPAAQGCGDFMPQNAEASEWERQKQMWPLAGMLQHIILAQSYSLSH